MAKKRHDPSRWTQRSGTREDQRPAVHRDFGTPERGQHGEVVIEGVGDAGEDTTYRRRAKVRHPTVLHRYCANDQISRRMRDAGLQLGADFHNAGLFPPVVPSYQMPVDGGGTKVLNQQAYADYRKAIRAVGMAASPVLVHVCCLDETAASWARLKGWPGREGMAVLKAGLEALADAYKH